MMSVLSFRNFLIGILATLTMDVLSAATIKLRLIAPLSRHLVGRWFASLAGGQPFHTNISSESAINREVVIAVSVHYAIGVALAFLYLGATFGSGIEHTKSDYCVWICSMYEHPTVVCHVSGDGFRMVRQ